MNEADTCRKLIRPRLEAAAWEESPHSVGEQISFTGGRIVVAGSKTLRRDQKRADFLLRYRRDFTLAVVEAKRVSKPAGTGMQQAKDYADILGVKFAYATNGAEIVEFDYFTGSEQFLDAFPSADEMRRELTNLNSDIVKGNPNYVCRVTADEGKIGTGHLSKFRDLETDDKTPIILTTSQMLTTGVDAPTCKNIVLARVIGSMTDFKQIIGRGTRVKDDYGKLYFNIIDYTGSATRLFADPDFDGEPALATVQTMTPEGEAVDDLMKVETPEETIPEAEAAPSPAGTDTDEPARGSRKYYIDGGAVEIAAQLVYELDADGKRLRVVQYADYAGEKVRADPRAADLRQRWADPGQRTEIIERLEERGIAFDELALAAGQPDADPFDLLCHLAYNAPLRTRRERAQRLRTDCRHFFDQYGPEGRAILDELLEKYAEHGTAQFVLPDVLEVPPLSEHGNVLEIAGMFSGADKLRAAVVELQTLLYAA